MYRSHQEHSKQWDLELELKYELLSLVEVSGMRKNNPGWVSAVPYAHGFFLFSESEKGMGTLRLWKGRVKTKVNWSSTTIYCSLDVDTIRMYQNLREKSHRPGSLGFSMVPLPLS